MKLGQWLVDLEEVVALGASTCHIGPYFQVVLRGGHTLDCAYRSKQEKQCALAWDLCWTFLRHGAEAWHKKYSGVEKGVETGVEKGVEKGVETGVETGVEEPVDEPAETPASGKFMVVLRYGAYYSSYTSGQQARGRAAAEMWCLGRPEDKKGRDPLTAIQPLLTTLPRDMIHASEELCADFLCPSWEGGTA